MPEGRLNAEVVSSGRDDPRINVIGAQELQEKLVRGDSFKLVNALGNWEFEAKHIPGSLHLHTVEEAVRELSVDDEIVVYCSNPSCRASLELYKDLEQRGYRNLRRFAGGIVAWEDAGYPLEGKWVS
jgi:rhodanese-related sulfurtransferase